MTKPQVQQEEEPEVETLMGGAGVPSLPPESGYEADSE